jgi:hypothetical protein
VASGRRLTMLVVALALVGAPAVALTAFCVGESCAQEEGVAAAVPFCPLPADLRAGYHAAWPGRSPDDGPPSTRQSRRRRHPVSKISTSRTTPAFRSCSGCGVAAPLPDGIGWIRSPRRWHRSRPSTDPTRRSAPRRRRRCGMGQRPRLVVVTP